jgi:hypothetical protein
MPGYLTTGALRPNVVGIGVPTDLRPVAPSSLFIDGMTALAVATGGLFAWDSASLTPDDGATPYTPANPPPRRPPVFGAALIGGAR